MDYMVEYRVNGKIKMEVVSFEDFITSDFIEDFILDKLEDLEDLEESRDIKILHIEYLRDYDVDVYNL